MGLKLDECGGFIDASRFPISFANGNENLLDTVRDNVDRVREILVRSGAILLRGFEVTRESFGAVVDVLSGARLEYVYRSTPRTSVADRIFTATNYPPDREIPLHCEEAYQRNWPMLLAFYCEQPATEGGETPLADIVKVTARIDPEIVREFRQRGVCYIRNYLDGIDLPWADVFQTHSRAEVERFCAKHDIRFDWGRDGSLHTTQVCQGTALHPGFRRRAVVQSGSFVSCLEFRRRGCAGHDRSFRREWASTQRRLWRWSRNRGRSTRNDKNGIQTGDRHVSLAKERRPIVGQYAGRARETSVLGPTLGPRRHGASTLSRMKAGHDRRASHKTIAPMLR